MKARITTIEITAQRFDSVSALVKTRAAHAARNLPGFKGAYWFAERPEGSVRAVEFFDSPESLRGSRASAKRLNEELIGSVGSHAMDVQEYEVVATTGQHVSGTAMFCRSLTWQEDPLQSERAIRRIEVDVMPGVRQNPGFQGGFWLMDPLSGRCMGFTLWDTVEHLGVSGGVGRQMRRGAIERGQMEALGLQEYEIIACVGAP